MWEIVKNDILRANCVTPNYIKNDCDFCNSCFLLLITVVEIAVCQMINNDRAHTDSIISRTSLLFFCIYGIEFTSRTYI